MSSNFSTPISSTIPEWCSPPTPTYPHLHLPLETARPTTTTPHPTSTRSTASPSIPTPATAQPPSPPSTTPAGSPPPPEPSTSSAPPKRPNPDLPSHIVILIARCQQQTNPAPRSLRRPPSRSATSAFMATCFSASDGLSLCGVHAGVHKKVDTSSQAARSAALFSAIIRGETTSCRSDKPRRPCRRTSPCTPGQARASCSWDRRCRCNAALLAIVRCAV